MEVLDFWKYGILFVLGGTLFILEYFFDFRKRIEKKWLHLLRNFFFAIVGSLLIIVVYGSVLGVAHFMTFERPDVWRLLFIPEPLRIILFFLLFDLVLYLWHVANHQMRVLWRFHKVHHSDHDLDFSTAIRFHVGELFLSLIVKACFVYLTGIDPIWIIVFDATVTAFAMFNHSNIFLGKAEPYVRLLFVTPSMHRVHHSVERKENDSNYTTIFSWWDRLFGTLQFHDGHKDLRLGVKQFPDAKDTTFLKLFIMPFRE